MLKIKSLTAKNFLSIGNVSQAVSFDDNQLILVLGENLDQGGNDSRNGVGKTASLNALSYALYGEAIVKIKQDNLINKVNARGMVVTLEFEKDGNTYRIERGRKPKVFKFYANGKVYGNETTEETDEAQGDSRVTQDEIDKTLGVTHAMFKQIIALNTYNEPFLSLRANEQRDIIEQLLGITKLSEKAEILKENLRITKDDIKEEELTIKAIEEANKRIKLNIVALEQKSAAWSKNRDQSITDLTDQLSQMLTLDIDLEIAKHRQNAETKDRQVHLKALQKDLTVHQKEVKRLTTEMNNMQVSLDALHSSEHRLCPTCGSDMDTNSHDELITSAKESIATIKEKIEAEERTVEMLSKDVNSIGNIVVSDTYYASIEDAFAHKTLMDTLANQLESLTKQENPYLDQINTLRTSALQEVDFEKINTLTELKDHQEFLLKLLTSKDSFIRKKIIDHNLSFLNVRLSHYLDKLGLPHEVKFKSDLEVEITQYGRDFDFDNLSRGERTRLILALSWAFRDVYESLNSKINLMFIDELIDNGLDTNGVESALSVLKRMVSDSGRSIFLISHRDELIGRVTGIFKVIKEGGFSTFEFSNTGNI